MIDHTGENSLAEKESSAARVFFRTPIWKSAIVVAPLVGAALFIATGTNAQTSGSAVPLSAPAESRTVAPKDAPAEARGGPKSRDKVILPSRVASPTTTTDPATPAQTTAPVAPIDAPDAARHRGPKGGGRDKEDTGRAKTPSLTDAPTEERRNGPKGAGDSGRTEPAADAQPAARGAKPKAAVGHGVTETPPAPDTPPAAGRRKGPKGHVDHGRTNSTPLLIGALSPATVLALVVSGGNDRPARP